jgi:hypothetical protein
MKIYSQNQVSWYYIFDIAQKSVSSGSAIDYKLQITNYLIAFENGYTVNPSASLTANGQLSTINYQLSNDLGFWILDWGWKIFDCQLSTVNSSFFLLPSSFFLRDNCQLSTVNRLKPITGIFLVPNGKVGATPNG